jgi:hypothetical protein
MRRSTASRKLSPAAAAGTALGAEEDGAAAPLPLLGAAAGRALAAAAANDVAGGPAGGIGGDTGSGCEGMTCCSPAAWCIGAPGKGRPPCGIICIGAPKRAIGMNPGARPPGSGCCCGSGGCMPPTPVPPNMGTGKPPTVLPGWAIMSGGGGAAKGGAKPPGPRGAGPPTKKGGGKGDAPTGPDGANCEMGTIGGGGAGGGGPAGSGGGAGGGEPVERLREGDRVVVRRASE